MDNAAALESEKRFHAMPGALTPLLPQALIVVHNLEDNGKGTDKRAYRALSSRPQGSWLQGRLSPRLLARG